jgi:hypothetical protein
MRLPNAKSLVWTGASLTIFSAALSASQSLPGSTVYFLGGACGLSILIGGALQVDWCQQ